MGDGCSHCAAPSKPAAQIGQEASATGGPEGRRREGKREGEGMEENKREHLVLLELGLI